MRGSPELHRLRQSMDSAFSRYPGSTSLEMKSDYAKYLCVLVSGYIERSLQEIAYEYCKNRSQRDIHDFLDHSIGRLGNPNTNSLLDFVSRFSNDWRSNLEKNYSPELTALSSVVSHRNRIAHGYSSDISFVRIKEWYESSSRMMDHLASQFGIDVD